MSDSPLLVALRERGVLSVQEQAMLRAPDVLALPPRAQLEHLRTNRNVGFVVTLLAGGVRIFLLAGGFVSYVGLVLAGSLDFAWWTPLVWLVFAAMLVWVVPRFVSRVKALSVRLPSYEELGFSGR